MVLKVVQPVLNVESEEGIWLLKSKECLVWGLSFPRSFLPSGHLKTMWDLDSAQPCEPRLRVSNPFRWLCPWPLVVSSMAYANSVQQNTQGTPSPDPTVMCADLPPSLSWEVSSMSWPAHTFSSVTPTQEVPGAPKLLSSALSPETFLRTSAREETVGLPLFTDLLPGTTVLYCIFIHVVNLVVASGRR